MGQGGGVVLTFRSELREVMQDGHVGEGRGVVVLTFRSELREVCRMACDGRDCFRLPAWWCPADRKVRARRGPHDPLGDDHSYYWCMTTSWWSRVGRKVRARRVLPDALSDDHTLLLLVGHVVVVTF